MTKEAEREIDELYDLLQVGANENERIKETQGNSYERNKDFFERRWDSSFFANTMRY